MKVIASLIFALVVHAWDLSPVENLHDDVTALFRGHQNNLWEAHRTVMNTDLQLHHSDTILALSEGASNFKEQGAFEDSGCGAAILNFVAVANSGCRAVFVIFNNSYTSAVAGHDLIAAHCASGGCHQTLSAAVATMAQICSPVLSLLPANFIQNLKTTIVLTEMPCITADNDPNHFCFEDVIQLRNITQDPGVGASPSQTILAQYCTRCIVKLFAAASTFAPDYARVQFSMMAANCWRFPDDNGPFCILKFKELQDEDPVEARSENGTSLAHLDKLCHPCVRIFLRRLAILYTDPVFMGAYQNSALYLFRVIHSLDIVCLARTVGAYCLRELREEILEGSWFTAYPTPLNPCYNALIAPGTTCPPCASTITQLVTNHSCCAIALIKIADFATYVNNPSTDATDNRDDPTFPSNKMSAAFNAKCATQATAIKSYCTAVAVNFAITLRNIVFTYYALHAAAFHALVISDIAEFLGMVAADIQIGTTGTQVQSRNSKWYSSFVPSSFTTEAASDGGVSLTVAVMPSNDAEGQQISQFMNNALGDGSLPFPNTASDITFLADLTVPVSASVGGGGGSSASTIAIGVAVPALISVVLVCL